MADRVGYEVEGLNQVIRDLKAIGVEVEDLKDAFAAIAAEGVRVIVPFVPEISGALRADIRGNRAQSKAVITAGRARLPYAGPINYGWPARNIEAAEFMQKGEQEIGPRAVVLLETEINKAIQRKGMK